MEPVSKFFYNLTPDNNGGESITLSCEYYEVGLATETLTLSSYGSCASLHTNGVFTSKNLFKLAEALRDFESGVTGSSVL